VEGHAELRQAFAALLGPSRTKSGARSRASSKKTSPRILVAESCLDPDDLQLLEGSFVAVPDKQLARRVREGGWLVVIVSKIGTTIVRALGEARPALLVCTGPLAEDREQQLRTLTDQGGPALLGPDARLFVEESGSQVVVGPDALELKALRRALGDARIALCPTPGWLVEALRGEDGRLSFGILGLIHAEQLAADDENPKRDSSWVSWARELEPQGLPKHVLVPLGLPELDLDNPNPTELERQLAGHMLERFTGPVFPSPRVLAALARGRDEGEQTHTPSPSASALWSQAARALPRLGGRLQMEAPLPDVALEVPASAFLAQEALLRRERVTELRERRPPPALSLDHEGLERADQVLRASAEVLSEHESKVVLRGYGFEITRQAVASSASGAAQFADRIGYPVVLKALSPDLRRKAEIGAVRLDLPNAASVRRAHADILARVEREAPLAQLDGVVVAEMIGPGLEFRCGGVRRAFDEGIALYAAAVIPGQRVEPALFPGPLSWHEALELALSALQRLPTPALRRASDPRVDQLATVLLQLSKLFEHTHDRLRAVHLDPVRLLRDDERPYAVLDARIEQEAHLEGT
jgi:hypothetical protein